MLWRIGVAGDKTFSCFQAIEIISSVQGTPIWMPINFSSGKSIAT